MVRVLVTAGGRTRGLRDDHRARQGDPLEWAPRRGRRASMGRRGCARSAGRPSGGSSCGSTS